MKNILLLSICFVLFGCTTIDISENSFIRPDQRPPAPETLGAGYVMEPVSVAHADGAVSRGIYLRSSQSIATVLYFGGNEFRLDREGKPVVEGLAKAGVDIVIFDHRGYGRSDGAPTAELLKTDAADLYRFVRTKVKNRVVVYGLSLGSFVAASVTETQPIDGLVEARGRGIGHYLIEQMIGLAFSKHQATEVTISCFSQNVAGLLLYPKLGFQPYAVEERQDKKGNRVALIHMRFPRNAT